MILEPEHPHIQVLFYADGTSYVYTSYPDGRWSVVDRPRPDWHYDRLDAINLSVQAVISP